MAFSLPLLQVRGSSTELLDSRSIDATELALRPFLGDESVTWYFRIPRRLVGELKEDLIEMGVTCA